LRKSDSRRFFSCFSLMQSNLALNFPDTSDTSTTRWALRAWRKPAGIPTYVGMTRNPMRLTGTHTALSADVRSIDRLGYGRVMRVVTPGCSSFQKQSGTRQPD
jgi:hypothetical protein